MATGLVNVVGLPDVKQQGVKLEHRVKIAAAVAVLRWLKRQMLQLVKLGDVASKREGNMASSLVAHDESYKVVRTINPTRWVTSKVTWMKRGDEIENGNENGVKLRKLLELSVQLQSLAHVIVVPFRCGMIKTPNAANQRAHGTTRSISGDVKALRCI